MTSDNHGIQDTQTVSFVVVNFNSKRDSINCLNSLLLNIKGNVEVIVVDNGSTDGSCSELTKRFGADPRFKLIPLDKNLGFGAANNIGVEKSSGKYLIFLNNDTVVKDSFFAMKIKSFFERNPSVGIIQPKIIVLDSNPLRLDYAGGYIDKFGFTYRRGESEIDAGQYDQVSEVFYAKGAALAIRRELFDRVGGFDSDYFIHYDDIDLCWRVRLAGYRVAYAPVTVVYHGKSRTISRLRRTPLFIPRIYYNYRNHIATIVKNSPLKYILLRVPVAVTLLVSGNMILSLVEKDIGYVVTYFKALWFNVKRFRKIFHKRRLTRNHRELYKVMVKMNVRKLMKKLMA